MKDRYSKTSECIAKFKNGNHRYQQSALFNQVVQMLVRGVDPYDVIDHLVQVNEDTLNAFTQYLHRDTRPMIMSGPDSH